MARRTFFQTGTIQALNSRIPLSLTTKCDACKLQYGCKSPKMKVTGRGERRILIVGEAPGEEEDRKGRQFVGPTGQKLEQTLSRCGVDLRDCILTNALICHPPDNKIKNQRSVEWCRPNLLRTIRDEDPEVIILLGATAVSSLLSTTWHGQVGGVGRWAGWRIPDSKYNAWVCPTWHPSFLLRQKRPDPVLEALFEQHLRAAVSIKSRPWPSGAPDYRGMVAVEKSPDAASRWLKSKVRPGVTIAFDYETNMMKPDHPESEIVSCSVSVGGTDTLGFPWHGPAVREMSRILRDYRIKKIGCNVKFEDRWTRALLKHGVEGWRWDTVLAAHMLDNRGKIAGLKFQAYVLLGAPDYDSHIKPYLKGDGGYGKYRIRELGLDALLTYNALDSLLEYKVADVQIKQFKRFTDG